MAAAFCASIEPLGARAGLAALNQGFGRESLRRTKAAQRKKRTAAGSATIHWPECMSKMSARVPPIKMTKPTIAMIGRTA